jgi:tetratricopeptide (TPR) repeat protein
MAKALQINPDLPTVSANIAYNIGIIFMHAGNREEAERYLRTALELNPGFESARVALERLP